jgi:hypothetical protein
MKRTLGWLVILLALSLVVDPAYAVSPNPLQSAYWRFEEGPNGADVGFAAPHFVQDSAIGNDNDMTAASAASAPNYTSTVAPFPLRSGASNNLALDFSFHAGGGDDIYTVDRQIDNGTIGTPAGSPSGFTLEAAFRPDSVNFPGGPFQAIVAKNGVPSGSLPTLALKVRGDNGRLQIEEYDKSGTLKDVQSTAALSAGQWYAAAVVNDGSTLSLFLRSESDLDYVLQGSVAVNGALYQGADDWDRPWSIGRSVFGGGLGDDGGPADWFDGIIDEVRLTNQVLSPSEFLFLPVPEPGALLLAGVGICGIAMRHTRRRPQ